MTRKMYSPLMCILLTGFTSLSAIAQQTQTLREQVVDQFLQKSLAGATVTLQLLGRTTLKDASGYFWFTNTPIIFHQLKTHTAFNSVQLNTIPLNAGKEMEYTPAHQHFVAGCSKPEQ